MRQRFNIYTVEEKYLIQLHGVNVQELCDKPSSCSQSTGGEKSTQPTGSSIIEGVTTCKNTFTHNDIDTAHCVHHQ